MNRSERPRPDPAGVQKILLIRLRRIGDIVMTTPAVAALKRAFPRASISYVVEEPFRRLVEGNPDVDRVIALPAKQGAADFARFARGLRRETFDAVIDFHGGPRASKIAWLARGKFKVGYKLKYKGWIYDARVERSGDEGRPIHSVENHLNLVRALGVEVASPAPPLFLPEATAEEKEKIDRLWAERGLDGSKVVVVHVGAGNEFRDWGERNLAALAGRLAETSGVTVVLAGAEGDRARAERIAEAGRRPPESPGAATPTHPADDPIGNVRKIPGGRPSIISLAGELNLIELRELIARAALFVGPDSGPMHVAATTRTPIAALFGPTLPDHFAPWRTSAAIIQKDLACRPCKQRECLTQDLRCLRSISVDDVFAAVLKYV